MQILNISKSCTGCGACVNICPQHCISMVEDKEGFLYPTVNQENCINCGLCEKVCPVLNILPTTDPTSTYAAFFEDDGIRKKSSSGGVFYALAKRTIQQGGIVFGAGFSDRFKVEHQAVDSESKIETLMKSKYVQSDVGNQYQAVKRCLLQGIKVLFVGTPCQVAGLHLYLQRKYENLITVDFICHGVPSPGVWSRYLQELEKEQQSDAVSVDFIDKNGGWGVCLKIVFANGEIASEIPSESPYLGAFLQNIILRNSCYNCKIKGCYQSDITIGDYWGIKKIHPELYSEKGVSLVLVNTKEGEEIIGADLGLTLYPSSKDEALRYNPSWKHSSFKNLKRARFFRKINKKSIKDNLKQELSSPLALSIQYRLHRLKRK